MSAHRRSKENVRLVRKLAELHGCSVEIEITRGCHYRIRLRHGNRTRFLIMAGTPYSERARHQSLSQARRTLREIGVEL
jgi:hypothetical protein